MFFLCCIFWYKDFITIILQPFRSQEEFFLKAWLSSHCDQCAKKSMLFTLVNLFYDFLNTAGKQFISDITEDNAFV